MPETDFKEMPAKIRIVIADDNALARYAVRQLCKADGDIDVVAEAKDGNEALDAIARFEPDVALLDLRMPGKGGLDVLAAMNGCGSKTRAALLATRLTHAEFMRAMEHGVRGVVLKSMPPAFVVRCVRMVHAGKDFIEKETLVRSFSRILQHTNGHKEIARKLTRREVAVAELVATGLSNKQAAAKLGVTEGTVKAHLHRAYEKLDVPGRAALTMFMEQNGFSTNPAA